MKIFVEFKASLTKQFPFLYSYNVAFNGKQNSKILHFASIPKITQYI
jgi:hypothetical protein